MSEENEVIEATEIEGAEPSDESKAIETEGETKDESEDGSEDKPEGTEKSEPKKHNKFQKRIDELTRQRYEAEQRAAQAEQLLAKQQQEAAQTGHQSQKPTLEAYGYDEDQWAKAMEAWAEQGIKQQQEFYLQAERQKQAQNKQMEINRKIQESTLKAMEKYPDFQTKVSDPTIPSLQSISPAAYEALITSENMGDVAYYLANNPSEVYQIGSMSPLEAVRYIARLETKLSPSPKPTQAPKPPSTINGKTEAVTNPDKLPIGDWMKERREQLKR